jgi:hypothetical protein
MIIFQTNKLKMKLSSKFLSTLRFVTIVLAGSILVFDIVYCWRVEPCTPPGGLFAPFILLLVSEIFGRAAKKAKPE